MKKLLIAFFGILVLASVFVSAQTLPPGPQDEICLEKSVELIAGQHMDVGQIDTWTDEDYLYVKFVIDEPNWEITETHVHVASSMEEIPQTKKGNPKVGKFDYSMKHNPAVTEYIYMIPLEDVDETGVIAAHAVVKKAVDGSFFGRETAWGEGERFPGRNWAMYFPYEGECIDP